MRISIFILDLLELIFTVLFFIEMLLRIYGLSLHGYLRSAFNKYDCVVSICVIPDIKIVINFEINTIEILSEYKDRHSCPPLTTS